VGLLVRAASFCGTSASLIANNLKCGAARSMYVLQKAAGSKKHIINYLHGEAMPIWERYLMEKKVR
jgi:hypothetical protein